MPAKAIAKPSASTPKRAATTKASTPTAKRTTTIKPKPAVKKRAVKTTATVTSRASKGPARSPVQAKPKVATKSPVPRVRKETSLAKALPAPMVEAAQNNKKDKQGKPKKTKLVRDSFTMPDSEYAIIATLKKRCLTAGLAAKKSEILRAAVAHMDKLSDAALIASMRRLEVIKTGRPAKERK